jgi:hypothetical protein
LARDRKTVLERRVLPHERLWTREGWDIVTVDAVRIGRGSPDRVPVAIAFTVRGATTEPSGTTPQQIAAPRDATIAVTAPETAGDDPLLYFRTWAVDGLPVDSADTTLTTTIRPKARLTALYDREPARPAPLRCGRVGASTCGGTCPEGQTCAVREGCRCVPRRGPDLVVTSLAVESAGADCVVVAVIENVGDARSPASTLSVKGIAGNGQSSADLRIPPLAPGKARRQRTILHALRCASLNVAATADAQFAIIEREEGNNVLREQFE